MRNRGKWVCLGMALMMGTFAPLNVLASPEFAHTQEEWEALRDNKLEYNEIADLVHDYNNTVIQNRIEYDDYRGEKKDDISQDYYDAALSVYDTMTLPDSDSEDYGKRYSAYLKSKQQAEDLWTQGDDNVDDGETKKLGYDKIEAGLVKQAQELMIDYWSQGYSLESREQSLEQAKISYQTAQTKLGAGIVTQADVLSAQEGVSSAEAALRSARSNQEKTKESLCLMLGWTYGSEAEIGELPEPDQASISAINVDEDVQKGLEANYDLRILTRQINNARGGSNKETLKEQYNSKRETVANNIKSAYRSLVLASSDYDQANESYAIAQQDMAAAERKLAAGIITANEYSKQQDSCVTSKVNAQTSKLNLLKAQVDYEWAVKGLAGT